MAATKEKAEKQVRIRMIHGASCPDYSHAKGSRPLVPASRAKMLVKAGSAAYFKGEKKDAESADNPPSENAENPPKENTASPPKENTAKPPKAPKKKSTKKSTKKTK